MLERGSLSRAAQLTLSALLIFANAVYLRVITCRLKPGWTKLASALPIICCNLYLPAVFSGDLDVVICSLACLCESWLGSLKILALAFGRGPLCGQKSGLQFLAVFAAPIDLRGDTYPGTALNCQILWQICMQLPKQYGTLPDLGLAWLLHATQLVKSAVVHTHRVYACSR